MRTFILIFAHMEQNEIITWLDDPQRNYADGVRLLERHQPNKHLVRVFSNRSPRFAMGDLMAELRRLARTAHLTNEATKENVPVSENKASVPGVVLTAKKMLHETWVKLSRFHTDLFNVGEGNSEKEVAARLQLMDQRDPLIERYNSLYLAKEAFFSGTLTEGQLQEVVSGKTFEAVANPEPEKSKETTPLHRLSDLTLANAIHAAKQAINRYNNQLRYQSDTAQAVENPMKPCPRRDKIERKLAKRQASLAVLEEEMKKRVDGLKV